MPSQRLAPYRGGAARTVAQLMSQDPRARGVAESGAIWGAGIAGAGEELARGFQQFNAERQAHKQQQEKQRFDAERDALMASLVRARGGLDPQEWESEVYSRLPSDMAQKFITGIYGVEQAGLELQRTRQSVETGDMENAAASQQMFREGLTGAYDLIDAMGGPQNPLAAKVLREELLPMANEMFGDELTLEGIQDPETWAQVGAGLRGPQEEPADDKRGFEARIADAAESGDTETLQQLVSAKEMFEGAEREPVAALDQRLKQLQVQRAEMEIRLKENGVASGGEKVKLPAAALEKVARADHAIHLAGELEKRVDSAWLGPVQGRAVEVGVGLPLVPVSKDLARFYADTATLKNATIQAITGAQMSESESARIIKQVPTFEDKPEVWEQKRVATVENLRLMRQRIVTLASGDIADPSLPLGTSQGQAEVTDDPLGIFSQ